MVIKGGNMKKSILIVASILVMFVISTNIFIYKIYLLEKEQYLVYGKFIEEISYKLGKIEEAQVEGLEAYRGFLEDMGREFLNNPSYKLH